eukprot:TRINITY_DN909_c0_g1_i1.p1 TRINITY_DN909_c0_g1~~TRINITY_DN909_c0_g1_i1.p1  ORF type:complete len:2968 (+),score=935.43 TRINITY_DN909_c0_g1_i1:79-8904(+)
MAWVRRAAAALAVLNGVTAAELCYAEEESKAHSTAGEVCASLWNQRDTRRFMYLKDNGRCDHCGHCAPVGPLQHAGTGADKTRGGQGWEQISNNYGCWSNSEGIRKYQDIRMDAEADVTDCLRACELDPRCWAVDWRCSTTRDHQLCYLYEEACEDPKARGGSGGFGAASYRIVPDGVDTHSRPVFFDKKNEKLEVRVVDGVCGVQGSKSLEYCGEHGLYVVHSAEKDAVRIEEKRDDAEWKKRACWTMRTGQWYSGFASFESMVKPDDATTEKNEGYYLARQGWKLLVRQYRSSDSFKGDASWKLQYPVVEEAFCKSHADSAGHPNCVWMASNAPAVRMPGSADDVDRGFYWSEAGDAADGNVRMYTVGDHSFAPFAEPTFKNPGQQVEGVNIEFEDGYEEGSDHLHLDPEVATTHGLSVIWDKSGGTLNIKMADSSKSMAASAWAKIIAQVHFESESTERHHRKLTWNFGSKALYSDETGHFYEFVKRRQPVTWFDAKQECESRAMFGQKGYLVTITSAIENDVVAQRLHGNGWIGACDGIGTSGTTVGRLCTSSAEVGCDRWEAPGGKYGAEGEWRWCTGPESVATDPADEKQGLMFWKGTGRSGVGAWPTSTTDRLTDTATLGHGYDSMFSKWRGGQPDDWREENCAHFYSDGSWNDVDCENNRHVRGFVCEWDGGGDLMEAHGKVTVHISACISKPCIYFNERDCRSDSRRTNPRADNNPGGCRWYPSEGDAGVCYPQCEKEYYGALCDRHCNNQLTCHGNGRCDSEGYCKCNNGWDGEGCNWKCHKCNAWGDPHYTNFAGVKFDYHGVNQQFVVFSRPYSCETPRAANASECHDFMVYAKHYRCSGSEKRPIGCMDQVTLRDVVNGWSVQMEIDDPETPEDEHGKMWIMSSVGATPVHIDSQTLKLPHMFIDSSLSEEEQLKRKPVVLTKASKVSSKKFKYTFELPTNGEMHTKIEIQQDKSWKAPYMNVYVTHCGPLCASQPDAQGVSSQVSCVQGLCAGDCGDTGSWRTGVSKDCTKPFDTDGGFGCPGPHASADECGQGHIPKDPKPLCLKDQQDGPPGQDKSWCICDPSNTVDTDVMEITAKAMQWAADSCCNKYKECGATAKSGTGNYDQCVIEHCNMAWMGDPSLSKCLASVEEAVLHQGQCAQVVCPDGFEGEQCDRCVQNRFGKDCSITCSAADKCAGHGQCTAKGECWCQEGWGFEGKEDVDGDGAEEHVFCLHDCRSLPKDKCAEGVKGKPCQWIAATGRCESACPKNKYGRECNVECNAAVTCSGHGRCNSEGTCDCEKDHEGEDCGKQQRTCELSGRTHLVQFSDTGVAAAEADTGGAATVELYRTPKRVVQAGTPGVVEQYGVIATTYPCASSRCVRSISIYSAAARASVEVWLDGKLVRATSCAAGNLNMKECPELCGDFSCAPECGPAQDIEAMTRQGFFDTGAYTVPGWTTADGKPLRIVRAEKLANGQYSYGFEVGSEASSKIFSVDVTAGTDNGRSMDVVVRHPVTAASGAAGPPTKDNGFGGLCSNHKVDYVKAYPCPSDKDDPLPPPTPVCSGAAVKARVARCCEQYRGCAGGAVMAMCEQDECSLGSGDVCLAAFRRRAAANGCACWPQQNVVWKPDDSLEGGSCSRCEKGYYGDGCKVYCEESVTCSGHGSCNSRGGCDCADGWADVTDGGAARKCAVEEGCTPAAQNGAGGGWQVLSGRWTCSDNQGKVAKNAEKVKPVGPPTGRQSLSDCKEVCSSDPRCTQIDWWPAEKLCSIYHMTATACTGDGFNVAAEAVVSGESHVFSRVAGKKVCPPTAPPPCFIPGAAAMSRTGGVATLTVRGAGAAPCATDCRDGEFAIVVAGKTCAQVTPADIMQTLPAYYRKSAGGAVRAASGTLDYRVEEEQGWGLCYKGGGQSCPSWQPVERECDNPRMAAPDCVWCNTGWGPEGRCDQQCSRATCNNHGTCDFSKTGADMCVCDDLGDVYFAHDGSNPCALKKLRVPSPPPPCDQSDCTGHASKVEGSKPACKCTCRNKWAGEYCNVCPPGYEAASDCSRCKAGYGGQDCTEKCDVTEMCGPNGLRVAASEAGCSCVCKNRWLYVAGKGCTECPALFDPAADCAACKDTAGTYPVCGSTCSKDTHCIAANTASVAASGGSCVCTCRGQWTGERCDVCPPQYGGAACDQCAAGTMGTPPRCSACSLAQDCNGRATSVSTSSAGCECVCRNAWRDGAGGKCSECPPGFDEFESDCFGCLPTHEPDGKGGCRKAAPQPCNNLDDCGGRAAGTPSGVRGDCTCKPCRNMWGGVDCSECDRTRYGGADCDECADGSAGTPPNCAVCSSASDCNGHASRTDVVDGKCRCTCKDRWQGDDCSQCPSVYDQATCSKCANGGAMPLCGAAACSADTHCHLHASGVRAAAPVNFGLGDIPFLLCDCECRNEWGGSQCEMCPPEIGGDDCNACAEGFYGVPPSCRPCSGFCKNGATKATSSAARDSCDCQCAGLWQGSDCSVCPPNTDAGCKACLQGYSWAGGLAACVADKGTTPATLPPERFTPQYVEVGQLPCPEEGDCHVKKGEVVKVRLTGPAPVNAACDGCKDGRVVLAKKAAPCGALSPTDVLAEMDVMEREPSTRESQEFAVPFDPEAQPFKVCYGRGSDNSDMRTVPRKCPENFVADADGDCAACKDDWYGGDCRTFCTRNYTCHGHGQCTPVLGTCECDAGWRNGGEEGFVTDGKERHPAQQCFVGAAGVEEPDYFVPVTASKKGQSKGKSEGTVEITLQGKGATPAGCTAGEACADGQITLVRDTGSASCSAPRDSELLTKAPIPVSTVPDRQTERTTGADVVVPFDPDTTPYLVCYQPTSSAAPVPVQVPNVRGAAPSDSSDGGGGGSDTAMLVVGVVALVVGLAAAAWAALQMKAKNARRSRGGVVDEDSSLAQGLTTTEQFSQEGKVTQDFDREDV